jgi:Flp pilus assembly protein TadB
MALPKWNSEWEKPDPLRGARGWSRHHYVSVSIAVILAVTALGLLMPAVAKARHKKHQLDRIYEQLREAIDQISGGFPGGR